jgi:hypothetical protein
VLEAKHVRIAGFDPAAFDQRGQLRRSPLAARAKDLWSFAVTSMRASISSSNMQTCSVFEIELGIRIAAT